MDDVEIALVTGTMPDFANAEVDVPLVEVLTERGHRVHRPNWRDDTVDWSRFDVAVVRTTWDYTERRDEFVAWAARVGELVPLWNPADVLRWNTHKGYLIELEERGAPVVPTAWVARGDQLDLAALVAARGWSEVVVKPAVAAGADGLVRSGDGLDRAQRHLDELLAEADVMIQPFLPTVETHGELSVILFDGEVSHVVAKRPASGDFRVQREHGGTYVRLDPDGDGSDAAALARWVVEASGHDYLYARVDLLIAEDGNLLLTELEATEPDLYLNVAPDGAVALADAIERRARA